MKSETTYYLIMGGVFVLFTLAIPLFGTPGLAWMLVAIIWLMALSAYRTRILVRRQFKSQASLPFSYSIWNYLLGISILTLIVLEVILSRPEKISWFLSIYLLILVINGNALATWRKIPRFILTPDRLLENDLFIKQRKLADLHSIKYNLIYRRIKIRFVNEYDITLVCAQYNEQQLAAFIKKIIDQSPVEAEIDPAIESFINEHITDRISRWY